MTTPCDHLGHTMLIKLPGLDGKPVERQCPFAWCRQCGSIWLPRQPSFDKAFERHERISAAAPIDGVNIEGYWISPVEHGIILPGN